MRGTFRQSMAGLHAWSGLVLGWVLFAVFVTGAASDYRSEISRWMRPELVATAEPAADATVLAIFEEPHGLAHSHPQVSIAAATGTDRARTLPAEPATRTQAVMVGLHEAHFADALWRALFVPSGLLGCATIATGLILWTVARDARSPGLRVVEALNVGLPAANACYVLANRLVPSDLPIRAVWEVELFFAGWLVIALAALLRPRVRRWHEALTCAAALYLAVTTVDILSRGRAAVASQAAFLWFDAAMPATAEILFLAAYRTAGRATMPQSPTAQQAPSTP